jgi:hypothetical protein
MSSPDQPPVPRNPRRGVAATYGVIVLAVIGFWAFSGFTGRVIGSSSSHDSIPAGVRSSPGGYRAFHFWHSGYMGGK